MKLYRPVGIKELELIFQSGMKAFPPRLPEQPIFYPVLNCGYAAQIARDWNAKGGDAGFVLEFEVDDSYASTFERQIVGGREHEELWVPADQLGEFNRQIQGKIRVIDAFKGEACALALNPTTLLPMSWEGSPGKLELLYEGRFLSVKKRGTWEYVERRNTSGIVAILAVTSENKLLLVEQFRPPLAKRVIEIPAGLAGDIQGSEHEELAEAARRELLEETGYEAGGMRHLTEGPASAGLSTEVITFLEASDLRKVEAGGGDAGESIQVHEVPMESLETWLDKKRGEGCLVDYKIYAALHFHRKSDG